MALAVLEAQKTKKEQNEAIEHIAWKEFFANAVVSFQSFILIGEFVGHITADFCFFEI